MPELPEVETIKLGLQKRIIGKTLTKVQILSPESFLGNPNMVRNKKISGIWRRAKLLGIDLDDKTILFHLKMSGQLIYEDDRRFIGGHPTPDMVGKMPNNHTRVIFNFSDGSHLYFNDQRRFGWVKVVGHGSSIMDQVLKNLGPEPLDNGFDWKILKTNLLKHKNMPIKVAIMDQTVVSGVGNIYANEACFGARLDPRTKVGDLGDKEFKKLHEGVIRVIKNGIKHGGSTRAHFVDPEGHKGYFLDYAYVYGRDKHPCKICGTEIKKIQLGGRGTYFCPNCQKVK